MRSEVTPYPLLLLSLSTDVCCQVDSSCEMSETENRPNGTNDTDPNQPSCNHSLTSWPPRTPTQTTALPPIPFKTELHYVTDAQHSFVWAELCVSDFLRCETGSGVHSVVSLALNPHSAEILFVNEKWFHPMTFILFNYFLQNSSLQSNLCGINAYLNE